MEETKEYNSAKLIFDLAIKEYDGEQKRTSVIDTKVNIALPIVVTYFFLIIDKILKETVIILPINSKLELVETLLIILIASLTILCGMVSMFSLFKCIKTEPYFMVNVKDFAETSIMQRDESEVAAVIATYFIDATGRNNFINNSRIRLYKRGLNYAAISFMGYIVWILSFVWG